MVAQAYANGVHVPGAQQTLLVPILSQAGQRALRAAADGSNAMALDPAVAALLVHTAEDSAQLRAVLEQLAQALASGDVASASAQLQSVLVPAQQVDSAQTRFLAAQETVRTTLAAVEAANGDTAHLGPALPDPTLLRQLHTAAGEAAAALDDLALCAKTWADVLAPETDPSA